MKKKRCLSDYDKPFRIKQLDPKATTDAHGHIDHNVDANWVSYTTGYADVVSKGGREFWKVHAVEADISHVWYAPYSKSLVAANPEMRLYFEDETYEIVSVSDIDLDHQEVEIQTRRKVS